MFLDIGNIAIHTPVLALFGLEAVIIAAAVAGTAMSVVQGQQQAKQAEDAADMAQNQAEMEARRIEAENQYEQEQRLKERDLVLGRINRAYARSGLQMAGSPLLDEVITTQNMTMDNLMANYNSQENAKSVRYQGAATAYNFKQQGRAAKTAGYLSAGQSLMSGLGTVSQMDFPKVGGKTGFGQSGKYGNALRIENIGNPSTRNF